jgi:predicted Zn-dependent protease
VGNDEKQSLEYGLRALASDSVDTDRVTELAGLLMQAGAEQEAIQLCTLVLKRTPYDGIAAQILARARLASGDHSDRTLDLAHRAARFARSERSMLLLRDTLAARGEQDQADAISQQLNRQKKSIGKQSDLEPNDPDAT